MNGESLVASEHPANITCYNQLTITGDEKQKQD